MLNVSPIHELLIHVLLFSNLKSHNASAQHIYVCLYPEAGFLAITGIFYFYSSIAGIRNFRTFANKYMFQNREQKLHFQGGMRRSTLGQAARGDINFIWLAGT
jgi:hypothetical protein